MSGKHELNVFKHVQGQQWSAHFQSGLLIWKKKKRKTSFITFETDFVTRTTPTLSLSLSLPLSLSLSLSTSRFLVCRDYNHYDNAVKEIFAVRRSRDEDGELPSPESPPVQKAIVWLAMMWHQTKGKVGNP